MNDHFYLILGILFSINAAIYYKKNNSAYNIYGIISFVCYICVFLSHLKIIE